MFLSDKEYERIYDAFASEAKLEVAASYELGVCSIIDGLHPGDRLNMLGDLSAQIEARKGETTVIAGPSGHGKSALMNQVALDLGDQGKRVCLMSFEMTPARTLYRMCRQCLGREMTPDKAADLLKRMEDRIIVLDKVGSVTPKFVLGAMIKAARDFGCTHIIIDNLMKVCNEYGDGAYNEQKHFIDGLCALAKALKVHVWLVCHVRKAENETVEINKYSIRGSTAITDQVDNVILLMRNLTKERKMEATRGETFSIDQDYPDSLLIVDKQRNGEWQGRIRFWYDKDSMCFCMKPNRLCDDYFQASQPS